MNIGDLIQVREDIPFGPSVGDIGIVEFTEMQRVCVKSGILGLAPEDGGPVYDYEQCIMAMFSGKTRRVSTYYNRYDIIAEAS